MIPKETRRSNNCKNEEENVYYLLSRRDSLQEICTRDGKLCFIRTLEGILYSPCGLNYYLHNDPSVLSLPISHSKFTPWTPGLRIWFCHSTKHYYCRVKIDYFTRLANWLPAAEYVFRITKHRNIGKLINAQYLTGVGFPVAKKDKVWWSALLKKSSIQPIQNGRSPLYVRIALKAKIPKTLFFQ